MFAYMLNYVKNDGFGHISIRTRSKKAKSYGESMIVFSLVMASVSYSSCNDLYKLLATMAIWCGRGMLLSTTYGDNYTNFEGCWSFLLSLECPLHIRKSLDVIVPLLFNCWLVNLGVEGDKFTETVAVHLIRVQSFDYFELFAVSIFWCCLMFLRILMYMVGYIWTSKESMHRYHCAPSASNRYLLNEQCNQSLLYVSAIKKHFIFLKDSRTFDSF